MLNLEQRTLTLEKPISFGQEPITELHFREPGGREVSMLKKEMEPADFLRIGLFLADKPERFVNLLTKKDAFEVLEITSFLLAS